MTATMTGEFWLDAACLDAEPELFFPIAGLGAARADVAKAKKICMTCPVRCQCLDYAIRTRQAHGIWGGTTEDERLAVRGRDRKAADRERKAADRERVRAMASQPW